MYAVAEPTAARRVYEAPELIAAILDELDTKNILKIRTVDQACLRLAYDTLGRRQPMSIYRVQAAMRRLDASACGPQKVSAMIEVSLKFQKLYESMLAGVRTIVSTYALQSCPRPSPVAGEFALSHLHELREACPNLQLVLCDSVLPDRVVTIGAWKIDMRTKTVHVAEIIEVAREASLNRGQQDVEIAEAWTGYSIERSTRLILNHESHGPDYAECSSTWIDSIAKDRRVRAISFLGLHRQEELDTAVRILTARKSIGGRFEEISVSDPGSSERLRKLLDACAGVCLRVVCCVESQIDPDVIPPAGTVLCYADYDRLDEPSYPANQNGDSPNPLHLEDRSIEIEEVGIDLMGSGLLSSQTSIGQYLTVLELGCEEIPDPSSFLCRVIETVRGHLPALHRLRLVLHVLDLQDGLERAPAYSWPGTVARVEVELQTAFFCHDIPMTDDGELPYFDMAIALACICKNGNALEIGQHGDASGHIELDMQMDQPEFRDLIQWLQDLNPRQQQVMRTLDYFKYGLDPLRPSPYSWRSVRFDEDDNIIPFDYCVAVEQTCQLLGKASSSNPRDDHMKHARWAMAEITAAFGQQER